MNKRALSEERVVREVDHYSPKPRIMAQKDLTPFVRIFWRIMTLSVDLEIFFEI